MLKKLLPFVALSFSSIVTSAQVQLIDAAPGAASSNPASLTVWNNKLYFIADDSAFSGKMMTYDGTSLSTVFRNTGVTTNAYGMAVYNNKLYFSGRFNIPTYGEEVYSYDGTNPPQLVYNIMTGSGSSSPRYFFVFNSKLYFVAENFSNGTGSQLYSYDGSNVPTPEFVNNTPSTSNPISYSPNASIAYNNKYYFGANYSGTGTKTFEINTATSGVAPVFPAIGAMLNPIVIGTDLYFTTLGTSELWKYNGTGNPVNVMLGSNRHVSSINPAGMAAFNGSIYFNGKSDTSSKPYLYRFDIATSNLSTVTSLYFDNTRPLGEEMNGLMVFNNALYLSIPLDAAKGRELYKYDGTSLSLVADINPGSTDSDPKSLTIFNGNLYFTAANSSTGRELYKLGSASGIQNIAWGGSVTLYPNPATSSSVLSVTVPESQELTVSLLDAQGKVVFTTGKELFAAGQRSIKLPLDNLASGQYYYQLNDKAGHPVASGALSKQ